MLLEKKAQAYNTLKGDLNTHLYLFCGLNFQVELLMFTFAFLLNNPWILQFLELCYSFLTSAHFKILFFSSLDCEFNFS